MNTNIAPGVTSYAIPQGSTIRALVVVRGAVADSDVAIGLATIGIKPVQTFAGALPADWPKDERSIPLSPDERLVRAEGTCTVADLPTAATVAGGSAILFQVWIVTPDARVVDVATDFPELFGQGPAIGGYQKAVDVDADAFYPALVAWGEANQTPAEWLLLVFYLESRINPHIGNALGYVGLNQLASAYLRAQFHVEPSDYLGWSASQQMTRVVGPWFTKAIASFLGHPPRSPGTLYALNIAPGNVKRNGDGPNAIMYSAGSREYAANAALDRDHSGHITISDFDSFMTNELATQAAYKGALADLRRYQNTSLATATIGGVKAWKVALGVLAGAAAIAGGVVYYKARVAPTRGARANPVVQTGHVVIHGQTVFLTRDSQRYWVAHWTDRQGNHLKTGRRTYRELVRALRDEFPAYGLVVR